MHMDKLWLYITCKDKQEAIEVGKELVEDKLVACANIIEGMTSMYWWNGKVEQEQEVILIAKTQSNLFDRVNEKVSELHSYEVPCVVAFPIVAGNKEYLDWITDSTQKI